MPRNLTIVLACLLALFAFLARCKAWVTFGVFAFLVALLAFLMWWREKIIEPDNERIRMAIRAIRRFQEGTYSRSGDGTF